MAWLTAVGAFLGKFFSALVARWLVRRDAAKDAQTEMAAEIAEHDRKRANEIRDRVDNARLGGGLHTNRPGDDRGFRD